MSCSRPTCRYLINIDPKISGTHCCQACKVSGKHGALCKKTPAFKTKKRALEAVNNVSIISWGRSSYGDYLVFNFTTNTSKIIYKIGYQVSTINNNTPTPLLIGKELYEFTNSQIIYTTEKILDKTVILTITLFFADNTLSLPKSASAKYLSSTPVNIITTTTTTVAPGSTTVAPGSTTVAPGSTTLAPGSTTIAPGTTTTIAPGTTTTTIAPGTTITTTTTTTVDPGITTIGPAGLILDGEMANPGQNGFSPFNFSWTKTTQFTPQQFTPIGTNSPVFFLLSEFNPPTEEWRTLAFFSLNKIGTSTSSSSTGITNMTVTQGKHYAIMAYDGTKFIYSEEVIYSSLSFTIARNSTTQIYTITTNFIPNRGFFMVIRDDNSQPSDFYTNTIAYKNTPVTNLTINSLSQYNGKYLFVFGDNTFGLATQPLILIVDI